VIVANSTLTMLTPSLFMIITDVKMDNVYLVLPNALLVIIAINVLLVLDKESTHQAVLVQLDITLMTTETVNLVDINVTIVPTVKMTVLNVPITLTEPLLQNVNVKKVITTKESKNVVNVTLNVIPVPAHPPTVKNVNPQESMLQIVFAQKELMMPDLNVYHVATDVINVTTMPLIAQPLMIVLVTESTHQLVLALLDITMTVLTQLVKNVPVIVLLVLLEDVPHVPESELTTQLVLAHPDITNPTP
jgi:hypothetical protein